MTWLCIATNSASVPAMLSLSPKLIRLAPNGTNQGLFQVRFEPFFKTQIWSEKSRVYPIRGRNDPHLSQPWRLWFIPSGSTYPRDKFLHSNDDYRNYNQAVEFCAERNSQLPEPRSQLENNQLKAYIETLDLPYTKFHLGMKKQDSTWVWNDGTIVGWFPKNSNIYIANKNCNLIEVNTGVWEASYCFYRFRVTICERKLFCLFDFLSFF